MIEISKPSILYIEDEKGAREELESFLSRFASDLYIAENGLEGFEYFKKYLPDIVISDIKMPVMDGIEMTRKIKEINSEQAIIFTSAFSDKDYFLKAIELSVADFILKPINLKKLKNRIDSITEQLRLNKVVKKQNELINEIATMLDNLIIVLDEKRNIIFMNNKALEYFNISSIQEFYEKHSCINDFILKSEYFYDEKIKDETWIDKIKILDEKQKVISLLNIKDMSSSFFIVEIKDSEVSSNTIIEFIEITDILAENKKLSKKAFFDNLTRIYNRTYFNQEIKKEVYEAKRYNKAFSLIFFDIDHFKTINDKYGHQIGDEVLKSLVQVIQKEIRESDTFARWGGEEFVLILNDTKLKSAIEVAEKLRKSIENFKFTNNIKVTCSFGVAEYDKKYDSKALLKNADNAMYKAKENGRNRTEYIIKD